MVALGVPVLLWFSPLLVGLVIFLVAIAASLLAMVPIYGLMAGRSYLEEWVIRPEQCVPALNRQQRLQLLDQSRLPSSAGTVRQKAAACVSVTQGDKELATGRVVLATSKALVLFNADTGAVTRVPTTDAAAKIVQQL